MHNPQSTPIWVQNLVLNALLYLQSLDYQDANKFPDIVWRHGHITDIHWDSKRRKNITIVTPRKYSSGRCYPSAIHITAGSDRMDCKLVILHELAHWVKDKRGHSAEFWDTVWVLYHWAKLPIRYCLQREKNYRKGSILSYKRGLKKK